MPPQSGVASCIPILAAHRMRANWCRLRPFTRHQPSNLSPQNQEANTSVRLTNALRQHTPLEHNPGRETAQDTDKPHRQTGCGIVSPREARVKENGENCWYLNGDEKGAPDLGGDPGLGTERDCGQNLVKDARDLRRVGRRYIARPTSGISSSSAAAEWWPGKPIAFRGQSSCRAPRTFFRASEHPQERKRRSWRLAFATSYLPIANRISC